MSTYETDTKNNADNKWKCNHCNMENNPDDDFCIECGIHRPMASKNHCSNPECSAYNVILPNPEQKHCGKCGSATTFWKKIEDMC